MINRGKLTAIAFDTPDDVDAWDNQGTPIVTTGVADAYGGTTAVNINDDDGAATEGKNSPSFTLHRDGEHQLVLHTRQGTATQSEFGWRDVTAATSRAIFRIDWAGPTLTLQSGSGTPVGLIPLENGWYAVLVRVENIVGANNNELQLRGALYTPVSSTGTTDWDVRNVVFPAIHLDDAISGPTPMEGSRFLKVVGGEEDSWITGEDNVLRGVIRWIPTEASTNPGPASGWDGNSPVPGVNIGWHHFLMEWAWRKNEFLWVPDRVTSTINVSSIWTSPMSLEEGVTLEPGSFNRRLSIQIRSANGTDLFEGY